MSNHRYLNGTDDEVLSRLPIYVSENFSPRLDRLRRMQERGLVEVSNGLWTRIETVNIEKQIEAAISSGLSGISLSSLGSEWEARGHCGKANPIVRVDINPISSLRKVLLEFNDKKENTQIGISKESLRNLENALDRLILACWAERSDDDN